MKLPLSMLGAVILGLVLRLAFSIGYWTGQPLTRDEREYLSLARSLAAGRGVEYDTEMTAGSIEPFGRAPGYPVFLALVGGGREVTASVPTSVKVAQSVVGALGVLMVGLLAARLAGAAAGCAAAVIAACYPPLVWISAYAYSEALIWPIGLALAYLFDRAAGSGVRGSRGSGVPGFRGSAVRWIAAGAVTGLAVLIRPATAFFAALAALWLLRRRRPGAAIAFVLAAAVTIAPWTIRNYVHHHRLVLVASEGGVTFWTGNHPLAIGEGDFAANPDLRRASQVLRARHPELTEEQMEPVYYEEALGWMRAHPWRWLVLEVRKAVYLVLPVGPSYRLHSARYFAASLISYLLILPAALIGLWRLREQRARSAGLGLLALSAIVAALVFFPQERFRIPIIDPALIICASALFGVNDEGERA